MTYPPKDLYRKFTINAPDQGTEAGKTSSLRARGSYYETAAAAILSQKGYEIFCTNYRCPLGEIDLIARYENYLVFIEVKYRRGQKKGAPEQSVDLKKRRRITQSARWYMMEKKLPADTPVRFDVVSIWGGTVKIYENAFYIE
ncbi:YraN family protein [Catenibacillus scindens]|uniref:YraN family protein n=1 Tax=Catenibacillus scindens TaxID=673271 RepID=UPI00320A382A